MMKRGFTLIELLVVMAMLAVLIGSVGSGVGQARKRALISKATQDVREITNAILAYENFAPGRSLKSVASDSWRDADEGSISFILGKGTTESGAQLPVLYNAQIRKGAICDPWGTPYQFKIKPAGTISSQDRTTFATAPSLPNFYRLLDEERQ